MSLAYYCVCDYDLAGFPVHPVCCAEVPSKALPGYPPSLAAIRREAKRRGWGTVEHRDPTTGKVTMLDLCPNHNRMPRPVELEKAASDGKDPVLVALRRMPEPSPENLEEDGDLDRLLG